MAMISVLPVYRALRGPTFADRMAGLDLVNTLVVGALLCFGAGYGSGFHMGVAVVYALLSYAGILLLSKHAGAMK